LSSHLPAAARSTATSPGARAAMGRDLKFLPGHKLTTKMTHNASDFVDYIVMLLVTCGIGRFSLRPFFPSLETALYICCAYLVVFFTWRHGARLMLPSFITEPMVLPWCCVLRVYHANPIMVGRLALAVGEHLLVKATPSWSGWHCTYGMRWYYACGMMLFHFVVITLLRTCFLVGHMRERRAVEEWLRATNWHKVMPKRVPISALLVHCYVTGIVCNIAILMAWCTANMLDRSLVLLPLALLLDMKLVGIDLAPETKNANEERFYACHYAEHKSKFHFNFFHGMHHDALPSGMLGVNEGGTLESFFRQFDDGAPGAAGTPLISCLFWTIAVAVNMLGHQYIPVAWPYSRFAAAVGNHHAEHHMLSLHPISGSGEVDERIDPYSRENKVWAWWVMEVAKADKCIPKDHGWLLEKKVYDKAWPEQVAETAAKLAAKFAD
jgi:hypothetical protein